MKDVGTSTSWLTCDIFTLEKYSCKNEVGMVRFPTKLKESIIHDLYAESFVVTNMLMWFLDIIADSTKLFCWIAYVILSCMQCRIAKWYDLFERLCFVKFGSILLPIFIDDGWKPALYNCSSVKLGSYLKRCEWFVDVWIFRILQQIVQISVLLERQTSFFFKCKF